MTRFPVPVYDKPDEGSAAGVVLAEFEALNADIRAALKAASVKAADTEQKVAVVQETLSTMQQKMVLVGRGTPVGQKSWGEQFVEADGLKEFAADTSRPRRFRLDVKSVITTDPASGGSLSPAYRDMPVTMPRRPVRVRSLLNVVSVTGANSVEYPKQSARTSGISGPTQEGSAKPESTLGFQLVSVPLRVVATWLAASRQVLDDSAQLRDIINSELLYFVSLAEDAELLHGDGTGQHILGMVPQATAFSAPITIASPTMIDTVGLGLLQSALADFPPDGIVLHPSDWMRIRLTKSSAGEYLYGTPGADEPAPRLFGLPVAVTPAMTVDKFLVGNFQAAATLYDRWSPRVEISTEHSDFFIKNLVCILAEERIGLGVKQPLALTYGDFGNVA